MSYHRNNWRRLAKDLLPGGEMLVFAADIVDDIGRSRLEYVQGGHPMVELPWQPPGPPPHQPRVDAVGRQAWDLLFADEERYGARSLLDQVAALLIPLPPTELDQLIRRFGPTGLERWDGLTHVEDEHGEPAYGPLRRQEMFNWLLRAVSPYAAMLIGDSMPCSQPEFEHDCEDHGWVLPQGPFAQLDGAYLTEDWKWVPGATEAMSWQDMDQGGFGTCWLLSSIQAIIQVNPQFAPRRLRQEANGTVSCTLYRDGRAVDVTVVPDLPYAHGQLHGAKGHSEDARYAETWPGYYEKAVAQLRGGYEEIAHGGYERDALAMLTGHQAQRLDRGSPWLCQEIADRKARGQAITAGTRGNGNDREKLFGGRLAASHAYFVKDVDPAGGRICLGNPWGDGAKRTMWECWLTLPEVQRYIDSMDAVPAY